MKNMFPKLKNKKTNNQLIIIFSHIMIFQMELCLEMNTVKIYLYVTWNNI